MHKIKFNNPEFNKVMSAMSQLKRQMHNTSFGGENKILHYLAHNQQRNVLPSEISKAGHLTTARIASALNSLESKELIKRTHSTKDRRQVFVNITNKGIKRLQDRMENMFATFSNIFNKLSKTDRDAFITILEKITKIAAACMEKGK